MFSCSCHPRQDFMLPSRNCHFWSGSTGKTSCYYCMLPVVLHYCVLLNPVSACLILLMVLIEESFHCYFLYDCFGFVLCHYKVSLLCNYVCPYSSIELNRSCPQIAGQNVCNNLLCYFFPP